MNKRLKQKWVRALLSGEYRQGKECLRQREVDENGKEFTTYCCLGVLRAVGSETGMRMRKTADEVLTASCGLSDDIQQKLAARNDSGRWNFKRIAAWIEKNL